MLEGTISYIPQSASPRFGTMVTWFERTASASKLRGDGVEDGGTLKN